MASYSSELTDETGQLFKIRMAETRRSAKRHSMKAINTCLLFCSVLGALVGLGYLSFDHLIKHIVLNRLVLKNNSEFAQIWENPPITPHLKIYFFNLTNPEEVFAGLAKPNLEEVGPYVYNQRWIKENVRWYDNGTMSYQTRKEFSFVPELSAGHHSTDVITTLNVPLVSAYYQMRNANFFTAWGLETIIYGLSYKLWVHKTPEELVWGYNEPLFDLARLTLPNSPTFEKFGFFATKNESEDLPTYTMFTGEGNPYNLSKISRFNGREHLNFWDDAKCDRVQGSDGATFNPYISEKETLWFFNDQLCRALPLVFEKEIESLGLPGFRFVPREDVFMTPEKYPEENSCYCKADETLCKMIGDGMFGVSRCQFDAPVVLSWPHFLKADSQFRDKVDGMEPDPEKHGFWFDVQQTTGTTLSAKARLQINIAVKHTETFSELQKVNDTIIPVLWFEEGLDELGPELVEEISKAVVAPPTYKNYILCVLVGLMCSTSVIAIVAIIRLCLNRQCAEEDDEDATIAAVRHLAARAIHVKDGEAALHQPMLGGSSAESSTDSSRLTSASHSRNSSTGSTPPYATVVVNVSEAERLQTLLDPRTKLPNT